MPICKRDGFDLNQTEDKNETFHDNDLVFCCYITKRIFRDYEQYFRHIMAINSTVWQCEATGKDGLTYEEAEKSERLARKKMEQFKQSLRAPVLLVIEHARQSSITTLNVIVSKFLRKRFFLNEEVTVAQKKNNLFKVIGIKPPKDLPEPTNGIYDDTEELEYRLRATNGEEISVPFQQLRRQRTEFNVENLAMFIKNNVVRDEGILRPKPEVYKQYVTEPYISFSSIFIGKMPRYSPAKMKKPEAKDAKKQSTLNKYIVKDDEGKVKSKARTKALADEMERMRLEKVARVAEQEREKAQKKVELMLRVNEECNALTTKTDDLERNDQRVLPTCRPIITVLPNHMIGDAFMLREFMHSYRGLLSGVEVFRQNLSFYEMTRALSTREVAGPLSDILLVLLGTIFDLQKEEEEECPVKYSYAFNAALQEPYISSFNASRTHRYTKRHFSFMLHELPLDALTLSEVLRLHLLASGAAVLDRADKWRIMYRNGYSSREDPGLHLRLNYPNIIRALEKNSISSLDFEDIMRVINCLMAQILTYSATINIVEERMEKISKAKSNLRLLIQAENRRLAGVEATKRKLTNEHHQQCMSGDVKQDAGKKQAQDDQLNRNIAELMAQSDREQRKHDQQVLKLHAELFNHMVYLGTDRCYRKYYVLESIPGIFIEHASDSIMESCLTHPPMNKSPDELRKLAQLPKQRRDLRNYLLKQYAEEDKKSRKSSNKQSLENKENQENQLNGHAEPMDVASEEEPQSPPTQYELFMCSGESGNCLVHDQQHPKRQVWSYIYQPDEIDALIKSLNPLGFRERKLLDELSELRTLIENHVKNCPEELLSLDTDKKRNKFISSMNSELQRKYNQSNFGVPDGNDLNMVMRLHLIDRILQFESDIYTGDLGRLKVKDMDKWRQQLLNDDYDPQCKLQWGGPGLLHNDEPADDSDNESHENYEYQDVKKGEESAVLNKIARKFGKFCNPAQYLNNNEDKSMSESKREPVTDPETDPSKVRDMASALLQIEQALERRFLKEPFGLSKKRDAKQEEQKLICESRLQQWEISLMESTSYSQVFLHLNILHDCILWKHSTNKSLCRVCRRGTDPEKMLLCDNCNAGTHMFCMKPKMRTVPEGNWYCHICVRDHGLANAGDPKQQNKNKKKRKFIVDEVEDEVEVDEEAEDKDSDDDDEDTDDDGDDANDKTYKNYKDFELIEAKSKKKPPVPAKRASARRSTNKRLRSKEIEEAVNEVASEPDDDCSEEEENEEVEEDEVEEEEEDEEAEEESVCQVCFYDGCEICCARCTESYHLKCANLKRQPRTDFICKKCKSLETQKSRRRPSHVDGDADDDGDHEEPPAKRSRTSRNSLRVSLDKSAANNNNNNNNTSNNNNNRRSGRRTNDNLPLNSSALYDLLEQTMKHQAAWPFLRPVLSSEVPDYYKIIKTPMDLAKIKSKLNMGNYQLNEELLNDIQLVFKNCDLYNVEGNEIYDAGSKLERFVMDCCKDLMLPFKPSDMNGNMIC